MQIIVGTDGKAGYRDVPDIDVEVQHKPYGRTYSVPLRELVHHILRGLERECDSEVDEQRERRWEARKSV